MRKIGRPPAVAGTFYPQDAVQLARMVDIYLKPVVAFQPLLLIVPHAGYVYSGDVAGAAFGSASDVDRVILVGVSHNHAFTDVRLSAVESWQTPLGNVMLNRSIISRLLDRYPIFRIDEAVHRREHGLEVQLPFLQRQLPDSTIVPILLSHLAPDGLEQFVEAVLTLLERRTLLVISSDLSHYPMPDDAERVDGMTIQKILDNDIAAFDRHLQLPARHTIPGLATCACGALAIKAGMLIASRLQLEGQLLRYANSGTASGAVGYAAIAYAA
jgi:AmmeMemoRadiSam system protein B